MATFGNSTAATFSYSIAASQWHNAASQWTMPNPGGIITAISVNGDDWNSAGNTVRLALWEVSTGNSICFSGAFTPNNKTVAGAPYDWWTRTDLAFQSPYQNGFIPGGLAFWLGVYFSTGGWVCGCNPAGSNQLSLSAATSANVFSSPTVATGSAGPMGGYITYTPGGMFQGKRGGSLVYGTMYGMRGGVLVPIPIQGKRGGGLVLPQ